MKCFLDINIVFLPNLLDLANSMLETFATEYRTAYGCEVIASSEDCDEDTFSFSLKYCPVSRIYHYHCYYMK